jgi:hypothetical protein
MSDAQRQIGFEQLGIGKILRDSWLRVPLNQREYSWTDREVNGLLHDLSEAVANDAPEYFLGSIVTIPRAGGILEVVDGQQRLATSAILLAAIRDYLKPRTEDALIVADIDGILAAIDRDARVRRSRLSLNAIDNHYFQVRVLDGQEIASEALSHRFIDQAAKLTKSHVLKIVAVHDRKNHGDVLNRWITYLERRAIVVLLKVPSEVNAYRMFETLNDRGLRTSQSDLVKNYLFGQATDARVAEAQSKWAGMRAILESFEDDDITINFLRQMLISLYGHIRQGDVYDTVASKARGAAQALGILAILESGAADYAAILNPQHEKWNAYPPAIRRSVEALALLRMRPLRPLMLSIARKLAPGEADKSFRLLISVSARLMIAGGAKSVGRSGAVEEALAAAAHAVTEGTITTTVALLKALDEIVPKDAQFAEAFATATVSKADLARYYLRSLEMTAKGEPDPYFLPNDDVRAINLEHVLPQKPEGNWPQFSPEQVDAFNRRLGNMALMQAKTNSDFKSAPFAEKKATYAASPYELTRQLAGAADWTTAEITRRQRTMADMALATWPLRAT